MLFSEVYGTYYRILGKLLTQAVEGSLTRQSLEDTVREYGFEETALTLPEALKNGTWPLLKADLTTPVKHPPATPLTTLQKQWLKTLLQDPRIRLFDPPAEGLEDVEPLYDADSIVYFDRYSDGDPFEDPVYIRNFRRILAGIRERRWMRITFTGRQGIPHSWRCVPYKLEYSPKDDKFRLISGSAREPLSINLGRITDCELLEPCAPAEYRPRQMKQEKLVLEVRDERNALERVMLHFSHLSKQTQRLGEDRYLLTLFYEREDETELLIRVLSFGPFVKVVSPADFEEKLLRRLKKQKNLRTQT